MIAVSNADRVVFPEIRRTKGDVVSYYERIAARMLPHVADRPLSIRRFPKGLAAPGFFQKNVPPHYPDSIGRFAIPRRPTSGKKRKADQEPEVTVYPLVSEPDHLAYLGNQGAIELHVPTARVPDLLRPDRIVVDLDPPSGALDLVRRAAFIVRDALGELGLVAVPVATGSKGYHVVSAIQTAVAMDSVWLALNKLAALLAAKHPDELTIAFRIAMRKRRVFVDWLRNQPSATVIAPYSLRARPRATIAVPLAWDEVETTAPDAFGIDDLDRLLDRPDPLVELAKTPCDAAPFVAAVDAAFERAGLVLEPFDRFRS